MTLWCGRCERSYRSHNALNQHLRDSPRHHECPECDFDGDSWSELLDHCRDERCRSVCQGCNNGNGSHWDHESHDYLEHLEVENVCNICERHFSSPSNLHQHRLVHRTAQYECFRCIKNFKTYGGMIIHLEYGSCSNIDHLDLNKLAAKCRVWHHFIDSDYVNEMECGEDLDESFCQKVFPYTCPTCDTRLPKLSSLFQHVESSSCSQTLDDGAIGQLRRFLRSRLG